MQRNSHIAEMIQDLGIGLSKKRLRYEMEIRAGLRVALMTTETDWVTQA